MTNFKLEIKPAIPPEERHKIEAVLKSLGYDVWGGGTDADISSCDISFDGSQSEHFHPTSKIKKKDDDSKRYE